jgi:hypothetical protein
MNARWLIRLYPPAWRRRYGEEFTHLLASQRLTLRMLFDVLAGAVDARLQPQRLPAAESETVTRNLFARCATGGSNMSTREQTIGAGVMLGASAVMTLLYIGAAAKYRGNDLVDAFGIMIFPAALAISMPFTYTRHQGWPARLITTGVTLAILGGAAWVSALI